MAGRHAQRSGTATVVPLPMSGPTRLTPVRSIQVQVFRTFAEGAQVQSYGPVWHRQRRHVPAGLVHAAELRGTDTLCGRTIESLHGFGRSRHAFERFDESNRCPVCNLAAGRPTT